MACSFSSTVTAYNRQRHAPASQNQNQNQSQRCLLCMCRINHIAAPQRHNIVAAKHRTTLVLTLPVHQSLHGPPDLGKYPLTSTAPFSRTGVTRMEGPMRNCRSTSEYLAWSYSHARVRTGGLCSVSTGLADPHNHYSSSPTTPSEPCHLPASECPGAVKM